MGRGYQRRGRSRERQIRESYTLQLRRGLEGCLAARCGRESLRAGEGAGRWAAALATVTEWGCRSLMVFNVAACGLPELPAAEEPPSRVGRKCTYTSQGRAAAWLNFLCIDVVKLDLDALVAPATARLLYSIHRHRQSEASLDARTASAAQLAMSLLRSRRPHAAATTPTPAPAHSGCVQIHREREEANAR